MRGMCGKNCAGYNVQGFGGIFHRDIVFVGVSIPVQEYKSAYCNYSLVYPG